MNTTQSMFARQLMIGTAFGVVQRHNGSALEAIVIWHKVHVLDTTVGVDFGQFFRSCPENSPKDKIGLGSFAAKFCLNKFLQYYAPLRILVKTVLVLIFSQFIGIWIILIFCRRGFGASVSCSDDTLSKGSNKSVSDQKMYLWFPEVITDMHALQNGNRGDSSNMA